MSFVGVFYGCVLPTNLERQATAICGWHGRNGSSYQDVRSHLETRYLFPQWERILCSHSDNPKQTAQNQTWWNNFVFNEVWFSHIQKKKSRHNMKPVVSGEHHHVHVCEQNFASISRLTIKASCPMYLHDFPVDKQKCPLVFGSCKGTFCLVFLF